jgi:hypothetical protein
MYDDILIDEKKDKNVFKFWITSGGLEIEATMQKSEVHWEMLYLEHFYTPSV